MPGVNKVLYNLDQRGETTPAERTTARHNIDAISADEVAVLFDDRYKVRQSPIDMTFASNAVLRRLWQNPNGEIGAECNYIYNATQDTAGLMSPADKAKLDGIAYGAEVNVQSDWNVNDESSDAFIRNRPNLAVFVTHDELGARLDAKQDRLTPGRNITIENNVISATADPQEQADWAQTDSTAVDYIKNKPQNLVQDADYHHTDNNFTTAEKNKLAGIEAGAETNVQADWAQANSSADDFIKNKPDLSVYATQQDLTTGLSGKQDTLTPGSNITITNNVISATVDPQVQADWAQSDSSAVDFIKNKPANLVQDADYHHTDNNFTNADKTKLAGVEAGAEANVQSDWTENDSSSDSYIRNRPSSKPLVAGANISITESASQVTIAASAAPQVNADWNSTSGASEILNKPDLSVYATKTELTTGLAGKQNTLTAGSNISIVGNTISATAAPQQNADWNATSGVTAILNKPDIPLLKWEQTTQGATNTYTSDHLTIHQDTHEVRMENADHTGDVDLGFVVPPVSSAPTENMVLGMASGNTVPTWGPAPSVPPLKDLVGGDGVTVTPGPTSVTVAANINAGNGIVVTPAAGSNTVAWEYSVGRNLHVNQNNAIQTNLPGGSVNAPTLMSSAFVRLTDLKFAGAYCLACLFDTSETYELAFSYNASGTSSTVSFIGTETIVATDNTVTTKGAVYLNETARYTPTAKMGGSGPAGSTAFDPTLHKAIIYEGVALIGPLSKCTIAIWNDNGTVKVALTAIEVGKVGATN